MWLLYFVVILWVFLCKYGLFWFVFDVFGYFKLVLCEFVIWVLVGLVFMGVGGGGVWYLLDIFLGIWFVVVMDLLLSCGIGGGVCVIGVEDICFCWIVVVMFVLIFGCGGCGGGVEIEFVVWIDLMIFCGCVGSVGWLLVICGVRGLFLFCFFVVNEWCWGGGLKLMWKVFDFFILIEGWCWFLCCWWRLCCCWWCGCCCCGFVGKIGGIFFLFGDFLLLGGLLKGDILGFDFFWILIGWFDWVGLFGCLNRVKCELGFFVWLIGGGIGLWFIFCFCCNFIDCLGGGGDGGWVGVICGDFWGFVDGVWVLFGKLNWFFVFVGDEDFIRELVLINVGWLLVGMFFMFFFGGECGGLMVSVGVFVGLVFGLIGGGIVCIGEFEVLVFVDVGWRFWSVNLFLGCIVGIGGGLWGVVVEGFGFCLWSWLGFGVGVGVGVGDVFWVGVLGCELLGLVVKFLNFVNSDEIGFCERWIWLVLRFIIVF